jgi:hypothetical protein
MNALRQRICSKQVLAEHARTNPPRVTHLFALRQEDIQDETVSREDLLEHLAV